MPGDLDSFDTLRRIVARLRAPDGCPWDRQQTHDSIKPHLLQECYEALEALDEGDKDKICDELGDILLHIMLHAQMGEEAGEFRIEDVLRSISGKLLRRHPHVFGEAQVSTAEEVGQRWDEIKKGEREEKGITSLLDSVPKSMPALAYAQSVQGRVAQVGFDWEDVAGVWDKVDEELQELRQASSKADQRREMGDVLFTLVNLARRLGLDAEGTLREANGRFARRFAMMEQSCRERGLSLRDLSLSDQNALWEDVKGLLERYPLSNIDKGHEFLDTEESRNRENEEGLPYAEQG